MQRQNNGRSVAQAQPKLLKRKQPSPLFFLWRSLAHIRTKGKKEKKMKSSSFFFFFFSDYPSLDISRFSIRCKRQREAVRLKRETNEKYISRERTARRAKKLQLFLFLYGFLFTCFLTTRINEKISNEKRIFKSTFFYTSLSLSCFFPRILPVRFTLK